MRFFKHNSQVSLKEFLFSINRAQEDYIRAIFNGDKHFEDELLPVLKKLLHSMLGLEFDEIKKIMKVKQQEKDLSAFEKYLSEQASPGERNLFYICIFVASLVAYRKDEQIAIILDEPESHLHMEKVIALIKTIERELPNATLWIATHSVHLIPLFDINQTIYLRDCKVQPRGGQPGGFYSDLYDSLMGTTADLMAFLKDIADWEIIKYFEECLFLNPETIRTGEHDPQTNDAMKKLEEALVDAQRNNTKLKILDYGAGKGRFGEFFDRKARWIEYHTFDLDDKDYENYIKDKINCHKSHYIRGGQINIPSNSFDFVLLMNTLHEIQPDEWTDVFRAIHGSLAQNGYMILCEPTVLSRGEYLGKEYGHLVLEDSSMKCLFGEDIQINSCIKNGNAKAISALIKKSSLAVFADSTSRPNDIVANTLKTLAKISAENFSTLRQSLEFDDVDSGKENGVKFKNARKLAFFAAQHINANLAVEKFGNMTQSADTSFQNDVRNIEMSIVQNAFNALFKDNRHGEFVYDVNERHMNDLFFQCEASEIKMNYAFLPLSEGQKIRKGNLIEFMRGTLTLTKDSDAGVCRAKAVLDKKHSDAKMEYAEGFAMLLDPGSASGTCWVFMKIKGTITSFLVFCFRLNETDIGKWSAKPCLVLDIREAGNFPTIYKMLVWRNDKGDENLNDEELNLFHGHLHLNDKSMLIDADELAKLHDFLEKKQNDNVSHDEAYADLNAHFKSLTNSDMKEILEIVKSLQKLKNNPITIKKILHDDNVGSNGRRNVSWLLKPYPLLASWLRMTERRPHSNKLDGFADEDVENLFNEILNMRNMQKKG